MGLTKQAERPLTRASAAWDFKAEVIKSKFSRRSAVRSSAWLDVFVRIDGLGNFRAAARTARPALTLPLLGASVAVSELLNLIGKEASTVMIPAMDPNFLAYFRQLKLVIE